jgi:hypothetical protein
VLVNMSVLQSVESHVVLDVRNLLPTVRAKVQACTYDDGVMRPYIVQPQVVENASLTTTQLSMATPAQISQCTHITVRV